MIVVERCRRGRTPVSQCRLERADLLMEIRQRCVELR